MAALGGNSIRSSDITNKSEMDCKNVHNTVRSFIRLLTKIKAWKLWQRSKNNRKINEHTAEESVLLSTVHVGTYSVVLACIPPFIDYLFRV